MRQAYENLLTLSPERFGEKLSQYRNAEAILRDRPHYCRVRIDEIKIESGQLSLKIVPVPTPGLILMRLQDELWISSSFDNLSLTNDVWDSAYGGWTLYFDPNLIDAVTECATSYSQINEQWDQVRSRSGPATFRGLRKVMWQQYAELAMTITNSQWQTQRHQD